MSVARPHARPTFELLMNQKSNIMKLYAASFSTILWRFYAMMAIGIASFVTGMYFIAVLCLPLLMISLLGVSFKPEASATLVSHSEHSVQDFSLNREAA